MKKILITGANSYIGTSFEEYMNQFEEYQIDTFDMIDGTWRHKDFSAYDVVFHVAGLAHSDVGKVTDDIKKKYYQVNTELAIETAKKAKCSGVQQFIFMSSAIVYGDSAPIGKRKIITKDSPVSPSNFYGDSKLQAENGIRLLEDPLFKIVILRPPMIYGRNSKGNYPLLSKIARKYLFFPYVKNERSMLYIDHLCELVRLLIENEENGIFFPQNFEYSNTSEMVKMISGVYNKKIILLKGFAPVLSVLSKVTGLVNKAFGNFCYEKSMSEYKQEYRKFDLLQSIKLTELGKTDE